MDNIVLIGMPGSGKSTVGVVLAKILGMDFIDTDLLIQKRSGCRLQQILDQYGLERFLQQESAAICSVNSAHSVIATGGSAVLCPQAIRHLQRLGKVLYLQMSFPGIEARIHNLTSRGIAMKPAQTLKDVYMQREPLYSACADKTVCCDGKSMSEVLDSILAELA